MDDVKVDDVEVNRAKEDILLMTEPKPSVDINTPDVGIEEVCSLCVLVRLKVIDGCTGFEVREETIVSIVSLALLILVSLALIGTEESEIVNNICVTVAVAVPLKVGADLVDVAFSLIILIDCELLSILLDK